MKSIKLLIMTLLLVASTVMAREEVNINFSNLQINDFIKLIGKITDRNILVHSKINGTVDLITTAPIYDDEVLGILISVLESKGFTLVQKGSMYEVVRSSEATKHNLSVVRPGKAASGDIMVTQAITVKEQSVDVIAAKIRYLISKTAKIMTMPASNTLLLTDYPSNIETVKNVIKNLDKDNKTVMSIVTVQHAEITGLHTQIAEISKTYFNPKIEGEQVTVLLNSDINSLIFIGKQKNVDELIGMVEALDKERDLNEVVQIFNLKNSDALSVKASLDQIIATQTFSDPALKPNISMSEEINSIIIVGEPNIIKGMKKIIDELDKEKYQVYVQARIVEINSQKTEDIGIKYGMEGGIATTSGIYTFSSNFGGAPIPLSADFPYSLPDTLGNIDRLLVLGAALDFLQTQGASKTISNPSILCVNNKESSIYVGKTQAFETGSITATTGSTTNSYKREDIGLSLKIKPRVSSNDKVTLTVETVLENVADIDDASGQPTTTKQTVNTEAILRHGESIIIGGLVKTYTNTSESKVPLLGDIPVLGLLFTHTSEDEDQDNLLVMLTPYIVDKSEKLSLLQEQLGELGRIQQEYNKEVFKRIEKKVDNDQ